MRRPSSHSRPSSPSHRAARADDNNGTVPTGTLRNVAGIVVHSGGRLEQVGTAFFVAVPSLAAPGRSFVYLVTAHHNLLDGDGKPRDGLMLTLEDSTTGAMREEPLPPENRWVLDPHEEKADVAAIPLTPKGASIAPIALASLLGSDDPLSRPETGAQVYYLTAATVGVSTHRFEALARFGHVSVPVPADTEVIGAGLQQLSYLDGGSAPGFSSGAPVFVSAGPSFRAMGNSRGQHLAQHRSGFFRAGGRASGQVRCRDGQGDGHRAGQNPARLQGLPVILVVARFGLIRTADLQL